MKSKKVKKISMCTVCRKPATRTVDGEPSCEQHAQLVYENQLEDYTKDHLTEGEWSEDLPDGSSSKTTGARARTADLAAKN